MSETSEQDPDESPGPKTRMTRRQRAIVLAWWGASAAVWGGALGKLGCAAAGPAPMRPISYYEADGSRLEGRTYCHGSPIVRGPYMWRGCNVVADGKPERGHVMFRFDLAARRADAVGGAFKPRIVWAIAPKENGSITECNEYDCYHVTPDRTRTNIPHPGEFVWIQGMAWVGDELQVVLRDETPHRAAVWAYRDKTWTRVQTVTRSFDSPKEVRLELAYHRAGAWQFLYARAPERVAKGVPVPVALHVGTTDAKPRKVASVELARTWDRPFIRGYQLPIDRSPGNIVTPVMRGQHERIAWDADQGWHLDTSRRQTFSPAYVQVGRRLEHFSIADAGPAGDSRQPRDLRVSDDGTHITFRDGTRLSAFTSDEVSSSVLLPKPGGGYWAISWLGIAELDDNLRRADAGGLAVRWSTFTERLRRPAQYRDYYRSGRAFKIASVYVVLLTLPLLWLVALVWYRRKGKGRVRTLTLSVAYVTIAYLACALVFGSTYLGVMKHL